MSRFLTRQAEVPTPDGLTNKTARDLSRIRMSFYKVGYSVKSFRFVFAATLVMLYGAYYVCIYIHME